MNERMYKYEYLTEQARLMLDVKKGYRDNTLFPPLPELTGDKTAPLNVVMTEIINCGKYEICDFLIIHYMNYLSRADYRLLTEIVAQTKANGYPDLSPEKRSQLHRIISKLTGKCNYCVWLCSTPDDIYEQYLTGYIPKADKIAPGYAASCPDYDKKISMTKSSYEAEYISEISIPNHAVPLCDLGREGMLLAFEKK